MSKNNNKKSISIFLITIFVYFNININCLKFLRHQQALQNVTYQTLKSGILSQNSPTDQGINFQYYDNLNSPIVNYYYGSITKQSYQMRIKLYKLDNYQICSPQNPYATLDMQSCKKCPNDMPLFNLGTRQCQKCKQHVTVKCDQILNISKANLMNATSSGSTLAISNTSGTKNNTTPTSTGSTTISNSNTSSYPTQSTLNTSSTTTKKPATLESPHIVTWEPKKNQTTNQNTIITSTTNKTNQTVFLPVGENNFTINQQNITNKPGSGYLVVENKTNTTTNNSAANLTLQNTMAQTKYNTSLLTNNLTFSDKQCPSSTPFYNINTQNCQACGQNQQYIPRQRKCLPIIYISNPTNQYVILKTTDQLLKANNAIKTKNSDRITKQCPVDQPFSVNNKCTGCQVGQIFNFSKQQCLNGCPQNQIFSKVQSNCIDATFITDPQANNLLSPVIDFQLFRTGQKNKVSSSGIITYCPSSKPFVINGKCSNCSWDNPYYNIETQSCQNCSRGKQYDSIQRRCLSSGSTGLEITKMIPNIF